MSLAADPPACVVPAAGGNSTHQLTNSGAERLVFKVESSNNNEYRIKPVFGFVEAGASSALEVIRLAGAAKEDKLVVQFGPAPANAVDKNSNIALVSMELISPAPSIYLQLANWFLNGFGLTKRRKQSFVKIESSNETEILSVQMVMGSSLSVELGHAPADAAAAFGTIAASPAGTITIPLSAQ